MMITTIVNFLMIIIAATHRPRGAGVPSNRDLVKPRALLQEKRSLSSTLLQFICRSFGSYWLKLQPDTSIGGTSWIFLQKFLFILIIIMFWSRKALIFRWSVKNHRNQGFSWSRFAPGHRPPKDSDTIQHWFTERKRKRQKQKQNQWCKTLKKLARNLKYDWYRIIFL